MISMSVSTPCSALYSPSSGRCQPAKEAYGGREFRGLRWSKLLPHRQERLRSENDDGAAAIAASPFGHKPVRGVAGLGPADYRCGRTSSASTERDSHFQPG